MNSDIRLFQKQKNINKEILNLENINKAFNNGQLGDPVNLGDIDFNEVLETGIYSVRCDSGSIKNQPLINSVCAYLKVYKVIDTSVTDRLDYFVYQEYVTPYCIYLRRTNSPISNNPITWGDWRLVIWLGNGYTHLYISKNGNDNNSGLTPDQPVLSVSKLIGIANAFNLASENPLFYFHFGSGEWGDVKFINIPYYVSIVPYDGTQYYESVPDEVAHFNLLHIQNCNFFTLQSVNVNVLNVQNSTGSLARGWNRINCLYVNNNSYFSMNNDSKNLYEVGQSFSNYNGCINIENNSTLWMQQQNFKLYENVTFNSFMYITRCSKFMDTNTIFIGFDYNGFTFTGKKASINGLSIFLSTGANLEGGVPPVINNFFGTGFNAGKGCNIDGNIIQ